MARTPRFDTPGSVHHAFNRGARRQVMFADSRDVRKFLACLACAVRRGEIEVIAFCILNTHFHLLVRSLRGELSYALMRIQNAYARYRNRRGRQDGPLVRGRFRSKLVASNRYLRTVIRYIDHNAVEAGLCGHPFEYPHGSARHFAAARVPPWLSERTIAMFLGASGPDQRASAYARVFGAPMTPGELEVIERRMAHPSGLEDELDRLFAAPPPHLARWMEEKVRAAGGRSPWTPVAAGRAVATAIEDARCANGPWRISRKRKRWDGWTLAHTGLLRALACYTVHEIGDATGCHRSTAASRVRRHEELVLDDAAYRDRIGHLARAAIDATFERGSPES